MVLAFRTSQRGDVALEQDGVERWRWSDGQMVLQVLGERELALGEVWSFALEGERRLAGSLAAVLLSAGSGNSDSNAGVATALR